MENQNDQLLWNRDETPPSGEQVLVHVQIDGDLVPVRVQVSPSGITFKKLLNEVSNELCVVDFGAYQLLLSFWDENCWKEVRKHNKHSAKPGETFHIWLKKIEKVFFSCKISSGGLAYQFFLRRGIRFVAKNYVGGWEHCQN